MTVIAMTREMGSLGKDVAAGVAQQMGLEVVHHELVERDVANKMKLGESDVHRFLEGKASLLTRWKIDKSRLSNYTVEEVLELATHGDVIIRGWGATSLLKRVPHVLRVRVCAPMDFRVRVLQERLELDDEKAARREIERNDAAHSRALSTLADPNWQSPLHYDLVLNTERVPIDECVSQVAALAGCPTFLPTERSRQILADLVIESHVRGIMNSDRSLDVSTHNVDIAVSGGDVVVSGAVETKDIGLGLCNTIKTVAGVRTVTNNLFVPGMSPLGYRGT